MQSARQRATEKPLHQLVSEPEAKSSGFGESPWPSPLDGTVIPHPHRSLTGPINRPKLERYLTNFGEYPVKYRLLVWRFLLQLPENRTAYNALVASAARVSCVDPSCPDLVAVELHIQVAKGIHPAFNDLHVKYPSEWHPSSDPRALCIAC